MTELVDQDAERHAVLQRHGDRGCESVHQTGDGRTFLGHGDEDFAGLAAFVGAGSDIAFMAGDVELVGDRTPLVGKLAPQWAHMM